VQGNSYEDLARREAELAHAEHERSEDARRFALRQDDDRMRAHFLRLAANFEREAVTHSERARRLEGMARQELGERERRLPLIHS
jgi:hypothetical protein